MDKFEVDTRTQTQRKMQATTIFEGQSWPQVKILVNNEFLSNPAQIQHSTLEREAFIKVHVFQVQPSFDITTICFAPRYSEPRLRYEVSVKV